MFISYRGQSVKEVAKLLGISGKQLVYITILFLKNYYVKISVKQLKKVYAIV